VNTSEKAAFNIWIVSVMCVVLFGVFFNALHTQHVECVALCRELVANGTFTGCFC